jgi:DNA-binding PadR family transcriptional regulator
MTNAELAILSLVTEKPRHGYEIDQVIEARGMRAWTDLGFSSIYYLLNKLEQAGMIEATLESAGRGPARKVYHTTPTGQAALQTGVREALSTPHNCRPPLQLGLANLPLLPRSEALAALRDHHTGLDRGLAHLQAQRQRQQPLPAHVDAMFEHSIVMIEAELGWLARFIQRMEDADDQD